MASRTCAVQILLVAFSRRICCSRVCMAMRSARWPCGIDGHADDAARHGALEFFAGGEEGRMRAAIAHGHAEALGRAHGNVGAQFAGRGEQRQRQQVGCHDGHGAGAMELVDERAVIADFAGGAGIGQKCGKHRFRLQILGGIANDDVIAKGAGAGLDDADGLRMGIAVNEEGVRALS